MERASGTGWSGADGAVGLSRHALRTPLLAIRAAVELLLAGTAGPLAAAARELLAASGEAASRLERLLEPLVRLAEWAGRPPGPYRPVELPALLGRHGVALRCASPEECGGWARAGPPPAPAVVVRAREPPLVELVELLALIEGRPLGAALRFAGRGGVVLLALEGQKTELWRPDERPLLVELARRHARLAGARLLAPADGRWGLVLRVAAPTGRAPGSTPAFAVARSCAVARS